MRTPMAAKSARDMLLSLAAILVPIGVIIALFARPGDPTPTAVDYQEALAVARREATFVVLAPAGLPDGWLARKARWARKGEDVHGSPSPDNRWEMGWLSPQQVYFGIQQSDDPSATAPAGCPRETTRDVTAAGRHWRVFEGDARTVCLRSDDRGVASWVAADASVDAVVAFVGTLRER